MMEAPRAVLERHSPGHYEGLVIERDGVAYVASEHVNVEADKFGGPEGHFVTEFIRKDLVSYLRKDVSGWVGVLLSFPNQTDRMVTAAHSLVCTYFPHDRYAAEKAAKSFSDAIYNLAAYRCEYEGISDVDEAIRRHGPEKVIQKIEQLKVEIDAAIGRQVRHWTTFLGALQPEGSEA